VVERDKFAAFLGAEHNMKKILYVGVGHALLFLTAGLCRAYGAGEDLYTLTHGVAVG
jgi:hypothetical protein